MSEQTTAPHDGGPSTPLHVVTSAENDWFLQSLVSMVNSSDLEIGITLFVGGFLVSGQLIGGKHYFEGFGATFAGSFNDANGAAGLKESFANWGKVYLEEDGSYKKGVDQPYYIHLKNARTFHPSGSPIPGNGGVWWRGRLREVSGFNLGTLHQD
ncbi:gas vesicle accessory protein GvpU [Burkholderia sp. Bmkn7]|uniref:gas vesicle accessory protein GvpU n=1 Tax=Burkholderia sp. Bmkn7 TaxID=3236841 RepID=UPI0034E42A38